jgi:hypothetical protein
MPIEKSSMPESGPMCATILAKKRKFRPASKAGMTKPLDRSSSGPARVEDGDCGVLGSDILERLYGVPAKAALGLLIDGIALSAGKRRIP